MEKPVNTSPNSGSRRPLAIILAVAVAGAISWLPAGIGNVGRKNNLLNGSFVRVTLPSGPAITHMIDPNQTPENVRDILVSRINAETVFVATVVNDPVDSNLAAFQVKTSLNATVSSLQIDETDTNIDDIGTRFTAGRASTGFEKVSWSNTIVGNGVYRLKIELITNPDYFQTFDTSIAPNDTAAGLDASIKASLISAGFSVTETTTSFVVTRSGDLIEATQVDCTDSGVVSHAVSMPSTSSGPGGLPALTDLGLFALVATLTGAGMALFRRRRR